MEYNNIRKKLKDYLKYSPYYDKTYCVGGCVRDHLLDRRIKDLDLVVEMPNGGIELAKYLESLDVLSSSPVVFESYGTTQFRLKEFPEDFIEVVHTRSKENQTNYGSLSEDCELRDLTINALYQPISSDDILDLSGKGLEDIKHKKLRVTSTPDIVFGNDPLRVLRCIRFSSVLGWPIEDETWEGVCKYSEKLSTIAMERIASELEKILKSGHPSYGLDLLRKSGCLPIILPELDETTRMTQNKYHFGTVWEHTLAVVEKCKHHDSVVLWSALFHDIGKIRTRTVDKSGCVHFIGHAQVGSEMCLDILQRFNYLSLPEIKQIQMLVARHMDFKQGSPKDKTLRKLQYTLGEIQYWRLLELIEADNLSHAPKYCIHGQAEEIKTRTKNMKTMFYYSLPITGDDIMEVKNIGPGKLVKGYLDYCLKLAFSNPDITKEQLISRIKSLPESQLGKKYL